ncbi:uncharacterized protein G2W53_035093 [Senna tora]|uniref:Uncharacterized protein n=1 Tax=Senna tora TaxID=362788 RepID=A0A834SSX5_9FABA|nr:uncharacterized protein G2W53_035093 [Senna tora]
MVVRRWFDGGSTVDLGALVADVRRWSSFEL